MKWLGLVFFSWLVGASPALAWRQGKAPPSINYNTTTYTTCNGVASDNSGFATWLSDALTYQSGHPGAQIQLTVPSSANTCMFLTGGTSPSIFAGLKNFILQANGATFSDGGVGGFFLGAGPASFIQQNGTASTVRIATVAKGASSITLLDTAKCSLISNGDWAVVAGIDPQGEGDPPNPQFYDFVQIASTASCAGIGAVTLVSPLVHAYKSTWPHYSDGDALHPDQGGPGTLYQLGSQSWAATHEYDNLRIDQVANQTSSVIQNVTFNNPTFTGGNCAIPSQNMTYQVVGGSMSGCTIEVDKIIGNLTYQNLSIHQINFQSSSAQLLTLNGVTLGTLNGSANANTVINSTITNAGLGPHSFGASMGLTSFANTSLGSITEIGAQQSAINLRGTWSGSVLTIPHNFKISAASTGAPCPADGTICLTVDSTAGYSTDMVTDVTALTGSNSCQGTWTITVVDSTHFDLQGSTFSATCTGNGGSLPLNWAVPGANAHFGGRFPNQRPNFQVNDLRQDATNTYVDTSISSIPTMPLSSGGTLSINDHAAPQFTCVGCSGSADAIDLNGAPAGGPLWQYSKRTLVANTCAPTTPVVPIWGVFVSAKINVTAAYTGASLSLNLNNPFIQVAGSTSFTTAWNPIVNAKLTGERDIFPGSSSGAQTGDTLSTPGTGNSLVNNQISPECSANISGSGDPFTATVEITTNQGVINP